MATDGDSTSMIQTVFAAIITALAAVIAYVFHSQGQKITQLEERQNEVNIQIWQALSKAQERNDAQFSSLQTKMDNQNVRAENWRSHVLDLMATKGDLQREMSHLLEVLQVQYRTVHPAPSMINLTPKDMGRAFQKESLDE